jgi:microcin C transport system substrate-binding protein
VVVEGRRQVKRSLLASLALTSCALGSSVAALAQDAEKTIVSYGLSSFGDLKYPAEFDHFDYVDAKAPKGGMLSHTGYSATETFDSFNPYIIKGTAPEGLALTSSDGGGSLIFDSLMTAAADEPSSVYGLVAYEAEYPPDRSWVIFRMRPEARFHDGSPITADDVKFTLDVLKDKGDPRMIVPLLDVEKIEVLGTHEVKISFKDNVATRDLPMVIATFPIFSKAYYSAHDFAVSGFDKPLSSGPYEIGDYRAGSWIEYDRVKDYWARDLPVNRGRWNFDVIRYEFYRDPVVQLEAFKAREFLLNVEQSSKSWALDYNFPAIKDGRVIKREIPDRSPVSAQGFYINTRRSKFADVRVRKALDLAFDFEWARKNLFYGQYVRTTSFFMGTDMEAKGPPSAAELALLEPFRDQLSPEVLGEPYTPPVTDGSGNIRDNLRQAFALLQDAGWHIVDGKLVNANGEPFTIEFIDFSDSFFRITSPYFKNLEVLGIVGANRLVDASQYEQRQKEFDFDIITSNLPNAPTPGIELRDRFGSKYADSVAGWNLSGIRDPVVDALVEDVIAAKTRDEMAVAGRALDRVLRAGHYWVPNWHVASYRTAYWDVYAYPPITPQFQRGVLDTWWSKPTP